MTTNQRLTMILSVIFYFNVPLIGREHQGRGDVGNISTRCLAKALVFDASSKKTPVFFITNHIIGGLTDASSRKYCPLETPPTRCQIYSRGSNQPD